MYLYLIRAVGQRFLSCHPVLHVFLSIRILLRLLPPFCTWLSDLIDCFYELIALMCIFYSSNKVPLGVFSIGLGKSVMVIGKP